MTHILIVGAGIGGLTAALCLHERGVRVTIAEAAAEIRPLGVGINLLPHGAAVLHELGLASALARTGIETRALEYRTRFGQLILSDPRGLAAGLPYPQYSIHRGALQSLLFEAAMERLPPGSIRTGLRLTGVTQDAATITGHFARAGEPVATIEADGLVGADGNRSRVCALMHPEAPPLRWNGITMWRGAVETDRFLDGRTMVMAGRHELKAVIYPISAEADARGKSLVNWVAEIETGTPGPVRDGGDWNRPGTTAEFLDSFEGMAAPVLDLPDLFRRTPDIFVYPMVDRDPLPYWTDNRLTLLGDAAHPMWPIGSNGASQAILDADTLAVCVEAHEDDVAAAFTAYEETRRPATAQVVRSNRATGPERVLALAHERVRSADDDVARILPKAELDTITLDYRRVAGFDADALGARAEAFRARSLARTPAA